MWFFQGVCHYFKIALVSRGVGGAQTLISIIAKQIFKQKKCVIKINKWNNNVWQCTAILMTHISWSYRFCKLWIWLKLQSEYFCWLVNSMDIRKWFGCSVEKSVGCGFIGDRARSMNTVQPSQAQVKLEKNPSRVFQGEKCSFMSLWFHGKSKLTLPSVICGENFAPQCLQRCLLFSICSVALFWTQK